MSSSSNADSAKFAIFRMADAPDFETSGAMAMVGPLSDIAAQGSAALGEAGYEDGHRLKLLFAMPGMSLTHVWFKSGFPLPRHCHDSDCLYYIIAGSLRLGTETLGSGDGFLIGADVPHGYTPGEAGVELLEFRTADRFDIKILADNPAFWTRALETVKSKASAWGNEPRPARN